jgi:hypothetical protein
MVLVLKIGDLEELGGERVAFAKPSSELGVLGEAHEG